MPITTYAPLSTLASLLAGQQNVRKLTADVQQASQELSTGLRANVYADLGQTATFTLQLRSQMDQTEAFATSNSLLGNKLGVISTALGTVHDSAQSVLSAALANLNSPGDTAKTLQQQARAALDQIVTSLDTTYGGEYLFSGTASDRPPLQGYDQTSPATGQSPQGALAAVVGSGPASAADATAMAAQIDAMFASGNADPAQNYQGTFYNGTPALDAAGHPNPRQTAVIAPGQTVSYGVQANDPAIRDVIQGLSMLASTDPSRIADPQAYKTWMNAAVGRLSDGVTGVTGAQATLGSQQQRVEQTGTGQGALKDVLNSRILGYEAADPYEVASRLQVLQNQLQATYQATAQLGRLSILTYL